MLTQDQQCELLTKVADFIERHPHKYNFTEARVPSHPHRQACVLAWCGYFYNESVRSQQPVRFATQRLIHGGRTEPRHALDVARALFGQEGDFDWFWAIGGGNRAGLSPSWPHAPDTTVRTLRRYVDTLRGSNIGDPERRREVEPTVEPTEEPEAEPDKQPEQQPTEPA